LLVPSERDIEPTLAIEAAEPAVTGAVQIIKKPSGFLGPDEAIREQTIEASTSQVIVPFGVLHGHLDQEPLTEPTIEVHEIRIDVVQERTLRPKTQGYGETAAKWFHETPVGMILPNRPEMGDQPAFASGPFERRLGVGDEE